MPYSVDTRSCVASGILLINFVSPAFIFGIISHVEQHLELLSVLLQHLSVNILVFVMVLSLAVQCPDGGMKVRDHL